MDGCSLGEIPCFDRLLVRKLNADLKWNSFIPCLAKDVGQKVTPASKSLLLLPSTFTGARSGQPLIIVAVYGKEFHNAQNRLRVLVGDKLCYTLHPLSHRRNAVILALLCRYFPVNYSCKLYSFVARILSLTDKIRRDTHILVYHHHSLYIPLVRSKFRSSSFFPHATSWWN